MFHIRRRNLKFLIAGGVLLLFYVYVFISSGNIDEFLSLAYARSAALTSGTNRTRLISPFEGPVEDLLGGRVNMAVRPQQKGRGRPHGGGPFDDEQPESQESNDVKVVERLEDDLRGEPRQRNLPPRRGEGDNGGLLVEEPVNEVKDPVPVQVMPEVKVTAAPYEDPGCCVEVNKKKTYLSVDFPPFIQFGKPGGPGENGNKVDSRDLGLTDEERKQNEKDYEINYFDEGLSRKIAVHRSLPDDRVPECRRNYSYLPAASVLIVFYNEAWTTLLRSIHSVLDRTPAHLLHEIVLLDDFSNMEHLHEPLEAYIQPLEKVRLLRATKRLGLIRARNTVFEHSKGRVVIFLDSHIECFPGWIEPLLEPIHNDSRTVTYPTIEYINPRSFSVGMSKAARLVGGLTLNSLTFNWLYDRKLNGTSQGSNWPSPTMPGGLYAVSRDWFAKLGKYDDGLDFWGGENLEMSFKTWMCGGSLLLVSCSHVGHIFRNKNPTLAGVNLNYKNAVRVAEVWMDQYKHYFYEKLAYNLPNYGDVSSRRRLRKSLECQSFSWYLINVFPELKQEMDITGVYSGEIRNVAENLCIDRQEEGKVHIASCRNTYFQTWQLTSKGKLVSGERIIGIMTELQQNSEKKTLGTFRIGNSAGSVDVFWRYDEKKRLVNEKTGQCLQADTKSRSVILAQCSTEAETQQWDFTTRTQRQKTMREKGVSIDWGI